MALELANTSLGKKATEEALEIMAGADDQKLLKAGEDFTGTILAFVINTAGTVAAVLAEDTSNTDIVGAGAGAEGYLNISGVDLAVGSFFAAGKYSKGANWNNVESGTAEIIVYYKYSIDRS